MGKEEGVVASLVMMFSGVCLVVFAPLFLRLLF
jgi:putative effector of murein hydrolase